jgi:tetratricopeptide (TPR) repeat protein
MTTCQSVSVAAAGRLAAAYSAAVGALASSDPDAALAALVEADAALVECPDEFDRTNVELLRGRAYRLAGDLGAACRSAARAVELARRLPSGERERPLVQALCDAADFERERGCLVPGRRWLAEAVEVAVVHLGAADPDTAGAWNSLGMWHRYHGDLEAARAAYDRALAAYELSVDALGRATVLHNVASLEHLQGRPLEAEATIRQGMTLRPPGDADLTGDVGVLAAILADLGHFEEAADAYEQVEAALGAHAPASEVAFLEANRAVLAHRRGRLEEAEERYRAALDTAERAFGPSHPQTGAVLANFAVLREQQDNGAEASALAARAVAVLAGTVSEQLPSLELARAVLAGGK